eukprot:s328_g18.t1
MTSAAFLSAADLSASTAESSSCLPGAVQLAERKNLKNPQGESYPLGIWVPDWAAGYAVSAIAHVLIEEMLGYNVVEKGPGPATPDAFYALAGCETPTVINRRGCSDSMSIYCHVSLEGWTTAYQSSWDDIQRDYPATAPLNLGTMGYVGRVSAFLTSELQEEAYYSEGLTLEYYRSYNVSWTNPSKYFDNITAIDTSRLKRCNETRSQVHAAMQQYWEVTGDNEGLDNSTGLPVGQPLCSVTRTGERSFSQQKQEAWMCLPGSLPETEDGGEGLSHDQISPERTWGRAERFKSKVQDEWLLEQFLKKHRFDDVNASRPESQKLLALLSLKSPERVFPIHVAAKEREGNLLILRMLLRKKVDPQQRTSCGRTALDIAEAEMMKHGDSPDHSNMMSLLDGPRFLRARDLKNLKLVEPSCFEHSAEPSSRIFDFVGNRLVPRRCFQDYFWLSPACRNEPTKCIIFLTAGAGYNFEHHMQRATAYDTPMAIAVAKAYADFQQMPTELNMQFYWWTPDDTFVAMTPREIIYPPSDRSAFKRGDYRGGNPDQPIEKYTSQDLAFLAPSVMELMKAFYIDINVVNSLLSDALATGDNYSTVACRWLHANEDIWRAWVPDPSQCFPQFGLFDLRSQSFVTNRLNLGPADTVECRACPAGLKSQRFADNGGVTHICQACEPGSYQSTSAATSCIPCPSGEYEDQPGQQACHRCEAGKYQDQLGQTDCKACPVGTTSLGRGAVEIEDCGCDAGSIKMVAGSNNCTKCSNEGMACPFASTVDVLRSQISPLGDDFRPRVLEGFYSAELDPLSIFKCRSTSHCPGGAPAHCAGGRRGIPCSLCPNGQTWLQDRCQDCPVSFPILWCLMFAAVLGGVVLLYHTAKQFVSARANLVDGVGMVCQVFWELGQTLAVISQMTIDWPEEAQNILAFAKFLIFDMDDFGLRCLLPGFRTASCYAFIAMCFPVVCLWVLLVWRISQFWKEAWRWKFSRAASLMGQVLMTEFSTISNLALVPFMCYSHPNGMHSLLKHPDVICGQEQHTVMLVIGIMLLVLGVLSFLVGCAVATIMLPAWTAQRRIWRVQMFQFLINRFRHDSWWYEVPLLTRGPLLSLALVLAIDSPAMQVQSIGVILTFYGFLLASAWPWKLPLLNLIDMALAFGIVVLVNAAPSDTRNNAAMPVMAICLLSGITFVVIVITLISLIRYLCLKTEDRRLWNLGGLKKPSVIAAKLKEVSLALKTQSQREYAQIERAIGNMSVHDVRQMSTCISILAFELIPMKGNKRSAGGSAWSVMTDNEANFGLYRLSVIDAQKNLGMGSDDKAEDADDDGDGRGFRWSERPPSVPNSDEEEIPNGQANSSMPLEPDEVPDAPAVDLPSAPDPEGLQELQQASHAQTLEKIPDASAKFPHAPNHEGMVDLPREALPVLQAGANVEMFEHSANLLR